jgi:hypothetical protein
MESMIVAAREGVAWAHAGREAQSREIAIAHADRNLQFGFIEIKYVG